MNIAPVSMMNFNRSFCAAKKEKINYTNNGAGENIPQIPAEKKPEKPAVTWHNYGSVAYPIEHKPEQKPEPNDDRRFNKF